MIGRLDGDLVEGLEQFGGIDLLLRFGFPFGVALLQLGVLKLLVLFGLQFLLLLSYSRRIARPIGGVGYGIRDQC